MSEAIAERSAETPNPHTETQQPDLDEGRALLRDLIEEERGNAESLNDGVTVPDEDEGTDEGERGAQRTRETPAEEPDEYETAARTRERLAEERGRTTAREELEAEASETRQRQDEWRRSEEARSAFQSRVAAFDNPQSVTNLLELQGLHGAEDGARRFLATVKNLFNSHHADSVRFAGPESAQAYLNNLYESLPKALPKAVATAITSDRDKIGSQADLLKRVVKAARDGYLSSSEAEDLAASRLVEQRRKYEKAGLIKPRGRGPSERGNSGGNVNLSKAELADLYGSGQATPEQESAYLKLAGRH